MTAHDFKNLDSLPNSLLNNIDPDTEKLDFYTHTLFISIERLSWFLYQNLSLILHNLDKKILIKIVGSFCTF